MTERELYQEHYKTSRDYKFYIRHEMTEKQIFEVKSGEYVVGCVNDGWKIWQASAKREGFVLVPKKCTNNMAHAAKFVDARLSAFKYSDVWDAMLSAVEVQNGLD